MMNQFEDFDPNVATTVKKAPGLRMQQQQSCPSTVPFCSSPSPAIATDEFQAKDDEMRSLKAQNAGLLEQLKVIQNLNLNLDIDTRLTLHNLNPNTNPH